MLQLAEQRLRLLQVARVKPLSAPAVNRSKELATLLPLALMVPEPRHAHCRWEFPELSLLLTGDSRLAYRTSDRQRSNHELCKHFSGIIGRLLKPISQYFEGTAVNFTPT